jgi:hypothetical protein
MWPKVEDYNKGLLGWLGKHHPNYLSEIGERKWNNFFSGSHHSAVNTID